LKARSVSGPIPRRKHASETEKAYFTGFLDARARFTAYIRSLKRRRNRQIDTLVRIDSTNLDILLLLQSYFGGTVIVQNRSDVHRQKIYAWQLRDKNDIAYMIEQILPYLKLKRKQAALLMQYCKSRLEKIKEDPFVPISKHERELIMTLIDINRKK